ncbi:hypothetical protein L6R52_11355 [Myxococcota bacterium]|nr:hypothetical protein [Myxococcota bacterium]
MLHASGYQVLFREHEWVECLLVKAEESWLGRGRDRMSALTAAVHAACPSSLSRALLERAIAEQALHVTAASGFELVSSPKKLDAHELEVHEAVARDGVRTSVGHVGAIGFIVSESLAELASLPTQASEPAISSGATAAAPAIDALHAIDGAHRLAASGHDPVTTPVGGTLRAVHAVSRPLRSTPLPPPLVRKDATVTRADVPQALDELDTLLERVRDSRDELGLCSPERQRLAMLAWICEARAHTDTFPEDARIKERVGAISRLLTEIGKTFWPGSVTALQLQMQPRDLPRHVLGGPAVTWARAAELAERALRSLEYTDERRGFDAYGWADAMATQPAPPEPAKMLDVLIAEVERYGGTIAHNAVPRELTMRPEVDAFRRWVRVARWLRSADVDPERWARLVGRLRWWVSNRDASLSSAARELDAQFTPERAWAIELGAESAEASGPSSPSEPAQPSLRLLPPHVLDGVRTAMSGKRMVFVSNRRDPDLQARLKDALPSATLDWRVAEPKRLEQLGEAIQQGAYDVVLGALGFQSQDTDHLLAKACRLAGVRYVRVNRGRPIVCLRALARDLHHGAA